jgi:hypothetical protein
VPRSVNALRDLSIFEQHEKELISVLVVPSQQLDVKTVDIKNGDMCDLIWPVACNVYTLLEDIKVVKVVKIASVSMQGQTVLSWSTWFDNRMHWPRVWTMPGECCWKISMSDIMLASRWVCLGTGVTTQENKMTAYQRIRDPASLRLGNVLLILS